MGEAMGHGGLKGGFAAVWKRYGEQARGVTGETGFGESGVSGGGDGREK